MLGDSAASADVTQDVFIKLWEHRGDLDEERILGWLLRVARNRNCFSNQMSALQVFVSGPLFSFQEIQDHRNPTQPFPYAL
jgi:hypothetical protein